MNIRHVLPKDAIPSIDTPTFGTDYFGNDGDDVIVVDSVPPKAYPVRILNYHEIVNDTVGSGDDPIAVTWCPLCGSAVVYDRQVDGDTLTFGVSGKLADDDLVMYDRKTGSEWKQSTGICLRGQYEGQRLTVRSSAVMPWQTFQDRYPEGQVLQPETNARSEAASDDDTPEPIAYDERPYAGYFDSEGFGLAAHRGSEDTRDWGRDDLEPKTVVLGLEVGDEAVGYPLPHVADAGGVIHDSIAGTDVVVFATDEGIHAFENPGYEFEATADGQYGADSTTWNGATGEATDGRELSRLPARRLFAFAWQDDHGPEAFFRRE